MARSDTLTAKANRLLVLGDYAVNRAESRRLLRKCRHYRRLAKEARKIEQKK